MLIGFWFPHINFVRDWLCRLSFKIMLLMFVSLWKPEITCFFSFLSPPLRAKVFWCLNSGPSLFTQSTADISHTAKLHNLATQRAENSCMKPSNCFDRASLKRPENVTLVQTHSVLCCFPNSTYLSLTLKLSVWLHFPAAHTADRKGQINNCFYFFFLLTKVMGKD